MSVPQQCAVDYIEFKARVFNRTGIDLNLYKERQMHRRLLTMVERSRAADFVEYFELLERDTDEFDTFLDRITINVSEFFRNPDKWHELRYSVLPALRSSRQRLRIWCAGCSYGAEPYSLAILLAESEPEAAHTVHATDIDRTVLRRAREGIYGSHDLRNIPGDCLESFFRIAPAGGHVRDATRVDSAPSYQVKPEIRNRVVFSSHNLLADRFDAEYDLICCRNVVIYFTQAAKDRLFDQFFRALAPGGVLFVGGTERLFHPEAIGFEPLAPAFYRRPT